MKPIFLHDKKIIEQFFTRSRGLHVYSLGDLDDFFWPYTSWFALEDTSGPREVALLYTGQATPAFLALSENPGAMASLVASIRHLLPLRFYAHLSPGVTEPLEKDFHLESGGTHLKMLLSDREKLCGADTSGTVRLRTGDLAEIEALYAASYPGNWFDQRMLATGQYFGIRKKGLLVSIAGIHVYSKNYRVAALGNITTHPLYRGQGLAGQVTAKLCQKLLKEVDLIGLNVQKNNAAAVRCYEKLGFSGIAEYEEFLVTRK